MKHKYFSSMFHIGSRQQWPTLTALNGKLSERIKGLWDLDINKILPLDSPSFLLLCCSIFSLI